MGLFLDINSLFHTEFTRVMLPQLMSRQPSLIINIGSGASNFACPYVTMISGAKAYQQAWSRSLGLEMRAEGQDVEILHLQVGMVATVREKRKTSLLVPTSRALAVCGLNVVECGKEVVWPYWPHALQFATIGALPEWLRHKVILGIALKEKAIDGARVEIRFRDGLGAMCSDGRTAYSGTKCEFELASTVNLMCRSSIGLLVPYLSNLRLRNDATAGATTSFRKADLPTAFIATGFPSSSIISRALP